MDAITQLKNDHKTVRGLFRRFEKARDVRTRRSVAEGFIKELSVHAAVEEQVFYPTVREAVEDTDDIVLESLEEHHVVKWTLSELDSMDPADERFVPKATVLMESVRHHMEEEESELFPKVRAALGRKRLGEIGELMETARKAAPTRPHPRSPDTPPGNLLAGVAASAVDRVRDKVKRR